MAASQAPKTSERKQIAIMTCGGCLACFCCILLVIAVGLGLRALGGGDNDPDLSTNSGGEGRLLATQFAPHRWAMVGDSGTFPASWGPIKSHVPIHGNAGPTVDTATGTWSCDGAGVGCTRFAYRKNDHGGDSNNIQTACTVCVTRMVDATECAGKPALEVDFERALAASDPDKGDADWTTDGDGFFFSVCKDGADILLNTSHVPLPTLMLRAVDALGEGPFTLDPTEFGMLRSSPITTRSGNQIQPALITHTGPTITSLQLHADGNTTATFKCESPECMADGSLVTSDDVVTIFTAFDFNLEDFVAAQDSGLLTAFAASHNVTLLPNATFTRDARLRQVVRLIDFLMMEQALLEGERMYDILAKSARVALAYTATQTVANMCLPSDQHLCSQAEHNLRWREEKFVSQWKALGFDVWASWMPFLDLGQDNVRVPHLTASLILPDVQFYNGVILDLHPTGSELPANVDVNAIYYDMIANISRVIGPTQPIIVVPWAGQMTFYWEGTGCEGVICESDFTRYYSLNEAIFKSSIAHFTPSQLKAFSFGNFDANMFDIKDPHNKVNKAGEAGYNNPLLNIWASR